MHLLDYFGEERQVGASCVHWLLLGDEKVSDITGA